MAIKTELTEYEFVNELRGDEYASWSVEAARALFQYYDELSEGIGDIEFDRVAIRCDWSEMHIQDVYDEYKHIFDEHDDIEYDDYDRQLDELNEHTNVIDIRRDKHMGNVLVLAF